MFSYLVFVILLNIGQLEQSKAYRINTRRPDGVPFAWNESKRGSVYLNANHPLWILEDSSRQHDMQRHIFTTTTKPLRRPLRQQKQKLMRTNSRIFKLPKRLKLPSHYMQPARRNVSRTPRKNLVGQPSEANLNYHEHEHEHDQQQQQSLDVAHTWYMPQFDNLPGEDNADPLPVFIYNGPKGELLLNTMLSAQKYPMQEPVPGQILYPPIAPLFRPKPIVERYRHNSQAEQLNLTLIPFYAHEAFNPSSLQLKSNSTTATTTAAPATVLYAAPAEAMSSSKKPFRKKKKRRSKWQDYKAYRSQHEVRWQPTVNIELLQTTTTTTFPLALASPLRNHRLEEFDATTTSMPLEEQHQTLKEGDESNFNIMYMDESLEKPQARVEHTVTEAPSKSVHSSRYSVSQEFYAFPVFTLAKLLKTQSVPEQEEDKKVKSDVQQTAAVDVQHDEPASDTWFILNSRYKGHAKHLENYRLSSKYVQNSASKALPAD